MRNRPERRKYAPKMKGKRRRRYHWLRDKGFTQAEAWELSYMSLDELNRTPYLRGMIIERSGALEEALARGQSRQVFDRNISDYYAARGGEWVMDAFGTISPYVWEEIRERQRMFKRVHPSYQSPSDKAKRKRLKWRG